MTHEVFSPVICPLCKGHCTHTFEKVHSFNFPLVYYQCRSCGFIFQDSKASQAANTAFYEETYRKVYQATEAPTTKDMRIQRQRAENQVGFLKSQGIQSLKRFLDIGSSSGVLMDAFAASFGAKVVGVEPGRVYRKVAQTRGLDIYPSLETLIDNQPERFQLISLMHILEHLTNPLETLVQLRQILLAPDGYLLIEVPNFYAHDSYELAHLSCFTPHSLRELVRQAGFERIKKKRHGFPRSKLLPLYITMLTRPMQKEVKPTTIKPEQQVRLKRKVALFYRRVLEKIVPQCTWLPLTPEEK